jgi:predicted MFS family arabinose efflux permease
VYCLFTDAKLGAQLTLQIILACLPGYMSFIAAQFWLSFFMQEVQRLTPILVAVHLLPQAIAGLIYNVIAGSVLHRINNTLLLVLGSATYLASNVLLALMKPDSLYWAFVFPAIILAVVGADFQFNVANVSLFSVLILTESLHRDADRD